MAKPPYASTTKRWVTLAKSKYGDPVAGIIFPDLEQATGWMFVLPRVERRADLVTELVGRVLPVLTPRMFPHAEGSRWTRRLEYDLPGVSALNKENHQDREGNRCPGARARRAGRGRTHAIRLPSHLLPPEMTSCRSSSARCRQSG